MASDVPLGPDFIRFLLSTTPKFDCYFVVGNKRQGEPERIGAVKLMLMAHSEVFRLELEDSELAEKRDVKVKDVHPRTFKGMLKYVYGHDTTSDMGFDDADNMLYVAEKYMMQTLKNKLAVRLMELLNPDNICSLLNNPACYKHLELDSAITEILKFETARVLVSSQFVSMNAEGFLKILEQNELAVPEIELWRAAIRWAKNKANSEDGQQLRQQLSCFTKHFKVCTLSGDELFEVATSDILTRDELGNVCQSVGKKRKPDDLTDFSDDIVPRKKLDVKMKPNIKRMFGSSMQKQCELKLNEFRINHQVYCWEYNFTLITKQSSIELLPLVCWFKDDNEINCTTTITKAGDAPNPASSSANESPITIKSSKNMNFEVPLTAGGRNVILLPDSKYIFKVELTGPHRNWMEDRIGYHYDDEGNEIYVDTIYTDDHLTLIPEGYFPSDKLQYRVNVACSYEKSTM